MKMQYKKPIIFVTEVQVSNMIAISKNPNQQADPTGEVLGKEREYNYNNSSSMNALW